MRSRRRLCRADSLVGAHSARPVRRHGATVVLSLVAALVLWTFAVESAASSVVVVSDVTVVGTDRIPAGLIRRMVPSGGRHFRDVAALRDECARSAARLMGTGYFYFAEVTVLEETDSTAALMVSLAEKILMLKNEMTRDGIRLNAYNVPRFGLDWALLAGDRERRLALTGHPQSAVPLRLQLSLGIDNVSVAPGNTPGGPVLDHRGYLVGLEAEVGRWTKPYSIFVAIDYGWRTTKVGDTHGGLSVPGMEEAHAVDLSLGVAFDERDLRRVKTLAFHLRPFWTVGYGESPWHTGTMDLRMYVRQPLRTETMARGYAKLCTPETPFYRKAVLDGYTLLRAAFHRRVYGNHAFVVTIEERLRDFLVFRTPMTRIGFRANVFADLGRAFDSFSRDVGDVDTWNIDAGIGLGVRLHSPVDYTFRVEYAFALQNGSGRWLFMLADFS